ncbi:hypothetical protein Emtol_0083 (plasmid) [Emticicia oligotrophica DSM 17448]|uniref:Transcriptional regulator, AbiEi antitoxin, Type IV TA system n=1 Tax=Emticicia oligotrophica (strain DSM 17448 / CIP 109782 / MTCC 6937 / GPTSA100-15) TaxID=929562 RepID=A0ABM5N831_EMTOG|nr:DUF6088 family protein [Emticicia oligotrophica]AFK05710.1 hypothetical protein Emtol_0083 [Emticicia oligotrophica DSM 17448]
MKVAEQIREQIKNIPESQPFGYDALGIAPEDFFTAAKALERLVKKGTIKKVSKGVFYKPKMTIMGPLGPDYNAILNDFLYKNKKRVGYITGGVLYNQLNLTTQNYFRTKIATNRSRKKIEMGWLKTSTVKSYVEITEENYQLLGILDAIKDIKNIADTSTTKAIKILAGKLVNFEKPAIQGLLNYALQYPPRVRALLGAIIEDKFANVFDLETLRKSLNPTTTYKISIKKTDLPTIENWNIK